MAEYTFTVFTPTHNRAETLHRVHDSLTAQTDRDFEWLIVDDGSTDDTEQVVAGWARQSDFPIRYIHQEHHGKHVAFNRGVREAHGDLFLSLDSDDGCVPTALERFRFHWEAIPEAQRSRFSAVTALCADQHGNLVGTPFPSSPLDSSPLEVHYRHKVRGDKWGFHRTSVLREFPFPEIAGETFVSERIVWDRIAARYQTRYVNERLSIVHRDPDRASLSGEDSEPARHAEMYQMVIGQILTEQLSWMRFAPLRFALDAAQFSRFTLHRRMPPWPALRALPVAARVLCLVSLPAGAALYARDRLRARRR